MEQQLWLIKLQCPATAHTLQWAYWALIPNPLNLPSFHDQKEWTCCIDSAVYMKTCLPSFLGVRARQVTAPGVWKRRPRRSSRMLPRPYSASFVLPCRMLKDYGLGFMIPP